VSRLRSLLVNLGVASVSLVLMALLIEGAARLYAGRLARPDPAAAARPISRFHPLLGWDKPPAASRACRRAEFDVLIQINARGLRGPDYDYAKPAGTRRVLILGDSFAEGYYVDEQETARAVLEKRLNAGPCAGWQVVNGGTIAYSTDQEYLFFREEGHRYAPDLVTLLFYHNDLLYNASPRGPGGEVKPYFQVQDGRLVARHETLEPDPEGAPTGRTPGGAAAAWRGSIALRLLSNRTVDAAPALHRAARQRRPRAAGLARPAARVLAYGPDTAARSRRCGARRRRSCQRCERRWRPAAPVRGAVHPRAVRGQRRRLADDARALPAGQALGSLRRATTG
jgi:lysophospholipase L1-like esterase